MRVFVDGAQVFDLDFALSPSDEIQIVQALNGGWDEGSVENGEFARADSANLNRFNVSYN